MSAVTVELYPLPFQSVTAEGNDAPLPPVYRRPRGKNKYVYKLHVTGTIGGQTVNRKYCSMAAFIDEFGGAKTPYNLTRAKAVRMQTEAWKNSRDPRTKRAREECQLVFHKIFEPRPVRYVYRKLLEAPSTGE